MFMFSTDAKLSFHLSRSLFCFSAFNESRYIAVCLYNLFFLGVLVSSLVFGLGDAVSGQAQVSSIVDCHYS